MKNRIWLALGLIFVVSSIVVAQTAKRTITNLDLDKYKQQREKSEAEYRAKHKEMGMPSPEELEQQRRENKRLSEESIRRNAYERQQNLGFWGIRANELRNQIINIEAQMRFLNAQIASLPAQNSIFASPEQVYSVGVIQYRNYGNRGYRSPVNPANNVQTVINASAANPNPFYGTPINNSSINLVVGQPNYPRQRGYRRQSYGNDYALPYPVNSNNSQRDELVARLNYLGQIRAGLFAQWNNLVDEARRAGVKID